MQKFNLIVSIFFKLFNPLKEFLKDALDWIKTHQNDILLFLLVLFLSLLCFGAGMLTQHTLQKEPLQIEEPLE